ncbi:CTD nuclear envelope phosphatase 1-like [Arachis ipaensis]|uniref:FCP1 homology domain-containing protein n=1 Tax=Arachis hypogaea TaxID=3818 RepID=A0A444X291_ARAHY|nr:CTD nuclear envelope phosphatase 1-like [Arachis ipaensis]XP_029152431.1 CTD nuclear envelope phosphatase 1-like [Arachis hypogaea]QHN82027.1 uncharacterized protein DS421_20g692100 [Arachis hypogaea]RYQ83779.1 hypothetical protein Ahy_B10g102616 [Arachis hypogaea]
MGEWTTKAEDLYAWRVMLNWLDFFFQMFYGIIEGVFAQYSLLSFSPSHHHCHMPHPPNTIHQIPLHFTSHRSHYHHVSLPLRRLTVVLDLDETLVCAYERSSLSPEIRTKAIKDGLNYFDLECVCSEKEVEGKPIISYVTVFERPGLKEFLRQLSEFADMVLFTAGLEGYASPVTDRIDRENRFRLRLYRSSTTNTEYKEHVKDLSSITNDLCRIVIVDNNPFSFLLQPENGIPCISFSVGKPHDTQLIDVILPLLKYLSYQKDVRDVLREKYKMPEWFQQQGILTYS